ncbi:MAG TPA: RimK/LysX family protein [Candidatus Saccharimonadales bacterium]|nr:RimK/LysX family protein [Candidatus Saccharimonadales bacterium]
MTKQRQTEVVVGSFEQVSLPNLGVKDELAKIDTGAFSGALHCTDIRVVRRGVMRKRYLKFTPLGDPKLATETDAYIKTYVRSATGHRIQRYIIDTTIELQGKTYPIRIGLSDRSDLKRNVLIGRRFLRENNILVDVRINQEHDDEGDNSR